MASTSPADVGAGLSIIYSAIVSASSSLTDFLG